jgi:hypothetical protein
MNTCKPGAWLNPVLLLLVLLQGLLLSLVLMLVPALLLLICCSPWVRDASLLCELWAVDDVTPVGGQGLAVLVLHVSRPAQQQFQRTYMLMIVVQNGSPVMIHRRMGAANVTAGYLCEDSKDSTTAGMVLRQELICRSADRRKHQEGACCARRNHFDDNVCSWHGLMLLLLECCWGCRSNVLDPNMDFDVLPDAVMGSDCRL